MKKELSFSIVINTLNRGTSLQQTLDSFRWLKYKGDFEVIVVNGPSTDNSEEVIYDWLPEIRAGHCDVANLSVSRNIGISIARGDIVAFIDDDGIPEPEWLEQLSVAYDTLDVGAVGGLVYDHSGYSFQYKFCVVDRLGNADLSFPGPTPNLAFPGSFRFPHLLGTNSSFRRSALLEIGGFDEEYEYFLDETDVCLRLVDAGYLIRQLPTAYVHHKFAPSNLRSNNRVAKYRYPILKNKIYFTLKHGLDYFSIEQVFEEQAKFINNQRNDVKWCVSQELLTKDDAIAFEHDVEKALRVGRARGHEGPKELLTNEKLRRYKGDFSPFHPIRNAFSINIVLISRDFPPGHSGGIATFTKDLATALAALGHTIHVVTESHDVNRVDFEEGVWVHRMLLREIERTPAAIDRKVPQHIWNWSATALEEVRRIGTHRRIDAVEAPIWDCEGIAFLVDNAWPLVTSLHTTLKFWIDSHPECSSDPAWMEEFGNPMLSLEKELMITSPAIRANSHAIVRDIQLAYGFQFEDAHLVVVPHGMNLVAVTQDGTKCDSVTILFVGRLEHRKGIDVLLKAAPIVLSEAPQVQFRIIGDNSLEAPGGGTYQSQFLASEAGKRFGSSVSFEGKVDDQAVREAYASCDVFVSPSRYESFGLIFLEAMREGKPVIGCSVGGMPEIIEPDVNGLLVPPGDEKALAQALLQLVKSPELRTTLGQQGLKIFEDRFTATKMAENSMPLYALAKERHGSAPL